MNILFSLLLLLPVTLFSQHTLTGKVVSEKQQPLQNASVFISNTTLGTVTNAQGQFELTNLPEGNIRLVISYVGYQTKVVTIPADAPARQYVIQMEPKNNAMDAVIVDTYDKNGWKNWGELFKAVFIGTSGFSEKCFIRNTDALRFVYVASSHQLRVYAAAPLIIENKALGYLITVTLADFTYNTESKDVDYLFYSLFHELAGTDEEVEEWKTNRQKAYSFSLMHFMRALYNDNLKNEGFEVRRLEKKKNTEKERIQNLYKERFAQIRDSLGSEQLKETAIQKIIGRSFPKDSLRYYKYILEQDDRSKKLHAPVLSLKDIGSRPDSNTVTLQFKDYLHVLYRKLKEPEEFTLYKTENSQDFVAPVLGSGEKQLLSKGYPMSELTLQQGIPVEVNSSGYFTNIDLYINGFWGWWEKMATRLPYGYQPRKGR
jgi:hypothetical protein